VQSGDAGTGAVLRNHHGEATAAACRAVQHCRDATEAELRAIEEGVQVALHWTTLPFTIETNCSEAAELIKESTPNT
jgi:ribonuclease HI